MSSDLIFELIDIALSLAQSEVDGTMEGDAAVAQTLAEIGHRVEQAYEDHTGEELNLNLVPAESGV
jgi:hypothetical protein